MERGKNGCGELELRALEYALAGRMKPIARVCEKLTVFCVEICKNLLRFEFRALEYALVMRLDLVARVYQALRFSVLGAFRHFLFVCVVLVCFSMSEWKKKKMWRFLKPEKLFPKSTFPNSQK